MVSDEEILAAQQLLASSEGIFAEPASCASLAGVMKHREKGLIAEGKRVVCVLTGNGLKDPDIVLNKQFAMERVKGDYDSVLKVLES